MGLFRNSAIAAALFAALATPASAATFDGAWNVQIASSNAACTSGASVSIGISNGQVASTNAAVTASGRVAEAGVAANSSLHVNSAVVDLCADAACTSVLATQAVGALAGAGTDVSFDEVAGVHSVRVTLTDVAGTFYGMAVAGLVEIEVIAKGE